jgi:hypothetical protein
MTSIPLVKVQPAFRHFPQNVRKGTLAAFRRELRVHSGIGTSLSENARAHGVHRRFTLMMMDPILAGKRPQSWRESKSPRFQIAISNLLEEA